MITALNTLPEVEVSAIVLNHGKLANRLKESKIPVAIIDESRYSFLQILKISIEIVASRQAEILHSHRYKENLLSALIKRRGQEVRLIQTVHGVQERLKGIRSLKVSAYGVVNRFVSSRYFDRILAVSHDIERQLNQEFRSGVVRHVANSIDLADVKTTASPNEIRNSLGILSDEIVVGAAGRMVPIKGFDILLKSAAEVLKSATNIRFVLVGDGPELENLKKMSSDLGISKNVMFTGFRDDVLDVINAFDIFLMTSWHEGIPVALLEAMALSKPTIATAVGGINEVIVDGSSGLTAPAGDVSAIARQCLSMSESAHLRATMGNQARLRVEEEFSSHQQKSKLLGIYKELVQ